MQTQARIVVGWMFAAIAAGGGVGARASAPADSSLPFSSNQWNTFSVDVTVRGARVAADGTPIGVRAAPVRYRWERAQSGPGWKTTMTLEERRLTIGDGAARREVADPLVVARIEDDEDGTPLRMYRKDGARLTPPPLQVLQGLVGAGSARAVASGPLQEPQAGLSADPGNPRRWVGSAERDWLDAFVATPQDRAGRRTRLGLQFVRKNQLRGLDRFVKTEGDHTHEILADPQAVVPVEINWLRDGALVAHSTIGYDTAADGSLVRRIVHTERALPATPGERAVVDTTYANMRVERRR